MSSAVHGSGTLLQRGEGAGSETFTTVAEVTNVAMSGLTTETIDVSNHSSASAHREHIAGMKDAGDVTFSINYQPNLNSAAGHGHTTGILADYANRTDRNWKLVFPDAGTTTFSFKGVITSWSTSAAIDSQLGADVTVKITSAPTLA